MYYVVYGFLYLFSLLPLTVLYLFSDLAYLVLYYIVGYRKEVIRQNLAIAFPEKSEEERKKIGRQFCRNLTDTFIETLKMLSIRPKELARRTVCDFEHINDLVARGFNVHIVAGHQFNWELGNLAYGREFKIPFISVYTRLNNKIFDKIFYKARSRYGSFMISKEDFRLRKDELLANRHIMALAADQNPSNPNNAYWLKLFGKLAPFITGPARGAVKQNNAMVFVGFRKLKRGKYQFKSIPMTEHAAEHNPEELTILYRDLLERTIRLDPANYLWSHRRWRHEWKPEYGKPIDEAV
ncbi:MAG: lipid A biosynthesis acyltransferase [Chitinophagaceae bacterium]